MRGRVVQWEPGDVVCGPASRPQPKYCKSVFWVPKRKMVCKKKSRVFGAWGPSRHTLELLAVVSVCGPVLTSDTPYRPAVPKLRRFSEISAETVSFARTGLLVPAFDRSSCWRQDAHHYVGCSPTPADPQKV